MTLFPSACKSRHVLCGAPRTSSSGEEEQKSSSHVDETLHQGRHYALRRGLQNVLNIFSRNISASDGPFYLSLGTYRRKETEGTAVLDVNFSLHQLLFIALPPSCLRPKCQVRCFSGIMTEEALETQYQPSKFLKLRTAYVGNACVEIQWSFLSIVFPLGCLHE
jgi:hypothetical protein